MKVINVFELIDELYGLFECEALPNDRYTMGRNSMINTIVDYVDNAVITDVQPVIYAHWTLHKDGTATCSNCNRTCGSWDYDDFDRFCRCCGATMSLKEK